MDTLVVIAIPVVLLGAGFVGLLALAMYRSAVGLESAAGRLEPVDLPEDSPELESTADTDEWARSHGFGWVGSYRTEFPNNPSIFIAAWQRADGTHLTHYRHPGGTAHDLVSMFDETTGANLGTTSASGVLFHPRPAGWWAQAFPGVSLDELLRRHQDALGYIAAGVGQRPVRPEADFEDLVVAVMRAQARHTRAHFLWLLRSVVWYLLRKRREGIPVDRQRRTA